MKIGSWTLGKLSRWTNQRISDNRAGLLVVERAKGASDDYWTVTETTSATTNGAAFNFLLFNGGLMKHFSGPYRLYVYAHFCEGQSTSVHLKADLTDIDTGAIVGVADSKTAPGPTACLTSNMYQGWKSSNSEIPSSNFPTTDVATMNINFNQVGATMHKRDLNYIAQVEKAISKKYGKETIQNPKGNWNDEKEKSYLEQIKTLYQREKREKDKEEKIEKDGFLISKKLLNKRGEDRTCPACLVYSFSPRDDVYMNKFDCCYRCYIKFVQGKEERWSNLTERVEFLASYYKRGE